MRKKNILPLFNTVLLIAVLTFICLQHLNKKEHVVYVNNLELFEGFNMTKDMKAIGAKEFKKRAQELDSLYASLEPLPSNTLATKSNQELQKHIATKSKALQELKQKHFRTLNEKVWSRLHIYVKEYAQTNNYKVILGVNGSGNIIYGKPSINITNELLLYSNGKYER